MITNLILAGNFGFLHSLMCFFMINKCVEVIALGNSQSGALTTSYILGKTPVAPAEGTITSEFLRSQTSCPKLRSALESAYKL